MRKKREMKGGRGEKKINIDTVHVYGKNGSQGRKARMNKKKERKGKWKEIRKRNYKINKRKRRNEKIEQLYFNTIHFTLSCGTLVDVCASAACVLLVL